jgi:two-component system, cell cycle response regulator DivK
MAGEPILIVDDTPVNLKLTRILLVNEGYRVLTAGSAEEALDLLRNHHPALVLADIQLPGIDGLELTRRIKQDEKTRDIAVMALTAFAMSGDEQKAIDAGCDGYITKPIDTRTLGARIRELLDRRAELRTGPDPPHEIEDPTDHDSVAIPPSELQALRRRFLEEGQALTRQWLMDLDGPFDANAAARVIHQWIGAGGLLGFTAISRLARETEAVVGERPLDQNQLRESLSSLALAFNSLRDARDAGVPESIMWSLSGKRIGLVGLPSSEEQRLSGTLERAEATVLFFAPARRAQPEAIRSCHALAIHVRPETAGSPWLDPTLASAADPPIVLIGDREHLISLNPEMQSLAVEFLMDSWHPEEALLRLNHAVSAHRSATSQPATTSSVDRPVLVFADDDPAILALVRTAVQDSGMDCHAAEDGKAAIETIRRIRPALAVLDVNMPGMNGYEVLSAIRAEKLPVRVLLLTARQDEKDILRGFSLGADDYVVKPFSVLELVARLKRLLTR